MESFSLVPSKGKLCKGQQQQTYERSWANDEADDFESRT